MSTSELDLHVSWGRLHAQQWGDRRDPLVLCLHGLSGNLRAFARIAPLIASEGRHVVAFDLRGRGRSDVTAPGTYGAGSHVRDVLEAADALGAEAFDLVGWSMGALVGIVAATAAPHRVRRLALLDHAGRMDAAALAAVTAALERLDAVVEDPAHYLARLRAAGAVDEWGAFWDEYFRYELAETAAGWTATTSRTACLEDVEVGSAEDVRAFWPGLAMPVLLVRCTVPLNGGYIVPEAEAAALVATAPAARLVELPRNHFGLMDDDRTADAVVSHLRRPAREPMIAS